MDLVNEEYDLAVGSGDFVDYGFESLFEFAFVFGACDEGSHVKRVDLLGAQIFRNVAADYALGKAFGYGCFTGARFADEHGVVFCSSREDLKHTADFIVAAYHRIELAFTGAFVQVDGIFREGLIGVFGTLVSSFFAFAEFCDSRFEFPLAQSGVFENGRCRRVDREDG